MFRCTQYCPPRVSGGVLNHIPKLDEMVCAYYVEKDGHAALIHPFFAFPEPSIPLDILPTAETADRGLRRLIFTHVLGDTFDYSHLQPVDTCVDINLIHIQSRILHTHIHTTQ